MISLKTLDEVATALASKYADQVAKFPERFERVVPKTASSSQEKMISKVLLRDIGVELPSSFRDMFCRWDFGSLEFSNFEFASSGDYGSELVKKNSKIKHIPWWEDRELDARPENLLMIAQADPHVLLLELSTGHILAYIADEGSFTAKKVSPNIETFFRILGTMEILGSKLVNNDFEDLLGHLDQDSDREFWRQMFEQWRSV